MKKTVLITGASRGIGAACAKAFAAGGYDLYLTCLHSIDKLNAIKKELEQDFPISCQVFICDVGDANQVKTLFSSIKRLDVLINNAGISHIGLLQNMQISQWRNVMSTNLDACFYTSKAAIPLMLQAGKGHILNVSSIWGISGASMETAYSASKGGMNAFTKALAKELAPSNIQVNALACGVMDTDMNRCFSAEEMESIKKEIPADRLGRPEEAAQMLLQLAGSPAYLTGQIISLDGGYL